MTAAASIDEQVPARTGWRKAWWFLRAGIVLAAAVLTVERFVRGNAATSENNAPLQDVSMPAPQEER